MKTAACLAMAVALAGASAGAQTPREVAATMTAPPTIQTGAPAAAPAPTPPTSTWIVSETRSPIDYTAVATATASFNGLQLAIQCRGGRSDMVVSHATTFLRPEDHAVFYAINDAPAVPVALAGPAGSGAIALKGDVARFLALLPEQGDIAFRVTSRRAETLEGRYALTGVKKMTGRLAGPCKWSIAAGN